MKQLCLFSLLLVLFLFSCKKDEDNSKMPEKKKEDKIVASVNDENLYLSRFKANFNNEQWDELNDEEKEQYINDWIDLTLLAQETDRLKISEDEPVKAKLENARKKIKANSLIAQKIKEIEPTEEEMFNYYKIHKAKYQKGVKKYRLQRIFVKTKEEFNRVKEKINSKELKFTEAARKFSQENLSNKDGYVGYITKDDIPKNIWSKLIKLKKYYYTSIKTNDGYLLFRYTDIKKTSQEKDYLDVKSEIKSIIIKERKNNIVDNLLKDIKAKSTIKIGD